MSKTDEELQANYDEKHEKLEIAIREMQEAWALSNGNTPGSLVTEWQLNTSAKNINENGDSVTQVMILGTGAAETLIGISRLGSTFWEQSTIAAYGWGRNEKA